MKIILEYFSYGFPRLWNHILLFTFQPIRFFLNVIEVLHHKSGIPREHINSESIHVSSNILIAVIQWCCLVKAYTEKSVNSTTLFLCSGRQAVCYMFGVQLWLPEFSNSSHSRNNLVTKILYVQILFWAEMSNEWADFNPPNIRG
mgnify:CR=1 FL=1